ncbi:MAG: Bug family tripartite tricarboxylate transporter substrate binding protein, partial [bacterium]
SFAAEYPTKDITLICPYGAGGGTDLIARQIAEHMGEKLDVNVKVENHPGAGSAIGVNKVANSNADGYTIGLVAQPISALKPLEGVHVSPNLIESVAQINADEAAIIVKENAKWDDLDEFINDAQNNPGEYNMGLTAQGATWWQTGQIFTRDTNIEVNEINYPDGAAGIIRATMSGEIDFGIVSAAEALSQVEDNELRYLVLLAEEGSMAAEKLFPQAPLITDFGYNITHGTWRGIVAPKGTPNEVITVLEDAIEEIVSDENFIEYMENNKFGIEYKNAEKFSEFMEAEVRAMEDLAEELE